MHYLELFISFLKIGAFAYGGAYGAIPIIRSEVLSKNWISEEMFINIVAISESTPGPIMVNIATYIGAEQGGVLGALLATIGVVLPSFVLILIFTIFFHRLLRKESFQASLKCMKQSIVGIILATGAYMCIVNLFQVNNKYSFNIASILIFITLILTILIYKKKKNKDLSPISIIILSGTLYAIFN